MLTRRFAVHLNRLLVGLLGIVIEKTDVAYLRSFPCVVVKKDISSYLRRSRKKLKILFVCFFCLCRCLFCYCDYESAVATCINTSNMKIRKKTIQTAAKNRKKYHDINNPILYLMELLVRCSSVRLSYPHNRLPHRKSKAY